MNESQRQLLADRLDDLGRSIDAARIAIAKAEKALARKYAAVDAMVEEKKKLEEGVDW